MEPAPFSLDSVLARLNQVGRAVNQLKADDPTDVRQALSLAVESAAGLLPASCAVLYTCDPLKGDLDVDGRITAGDGEPARLLELSRQVLLEKAPQQVEDGQGSQISIPLIVGGEILGVLATCLPETRPFHLAEVAALEHLASLSAMVLSQARQSALAQQEQAGRERELRRLRRAGMLISSRSSLKDTLDAILEMALEITDAIYGIFRLVDAGGENLVTQSFAGLSLAKPATETLPINAASVMGTVAMKREPVVISDLHQLPWKDIYYPLDHELDMRSEIAVPLIGASGRLEGVLNLESPEVNAFDREDRYILQILATQAVLAIEGIRLLDTLQDISARLYASSARQVHQALVERACDLLYVPASLIWLLDRDELVVQAASDVSLSGRRFPLGSDPASRVVRTGQPLTLLETTGEPQPNLPGMQQPGSALIVPLFTGDDSRPAGAFGVFTAAGEARDFSQSDWDTKVLSILGHYAALALQNEAYLEALRFAEDQRATTETFAAIGDIAANLLHRLNNKIGTIPVRVEGIQDKSAALLESDPYLAENLAEIQSSAAEAMQVVRESLEHLRPIQLAPVSVASCAREALASIHLPPAVQVTCRGLDDLPPVQAGANRLTLVFGNLLENAADAMQGRGKISLNGRLQGKWVEVRIGDSGPGIPADLHERIFDFSYSSRSASQPGKLGFGLWWVKSLMTRFGGRVAIESSGPGGTTFLLSLPVAREER